MASSLLWTIGLFAASSLASSLPHGVNIKRDVSELETTYDYIIAGGGTSGLTVADRLTAAFPDRKVLVVEYGLLINTTDILQPAITVRDTRYAYSITSQPETALFDRKFTVTVGKIVGGCSAINAQMFDRGSKADYDIWGQFGGAAYEKAGWNWDGLLPYFKKSTTFTPPTANEVEQYEYTYDIDAAYGGKGAVQAVYPPYQWPTEKVMRQAWKELGVPSQQEGSGGNATGVFWFPSSQDPKTQTRSYGRTAHYDPVASRSNYHLLVDHKVTELVMSKSEAGIWKAVGIQLRPVSGSNTAVTTVGSKEEVILAAGAIHTPAILQRSGIGPADVLKAANITLKVEHPGVGQNFQDHPYGQLFFNLATDLKPNSMSMMSNATLSAQARKEYDQNRTGPLTLSGGNSGAFLPLAYLTKNPSAIFSSLSFSPRYAHVHLPQGNNTHPSVLAGYAYQLTYLKPLFETDVSAVFEYPIGAGALFALLKPLSRGTVNIDPNNVDAEPKVFYNTFSNPVDLAVTVQGARLFRKLYATPSARKLTPSEQLPGANVQSDEEWGEWLRKNINPSFYHPVGTAALGPMNMGGVVGPDLKVHRVDGLRVVDASIMPLIPATHTSSTVYAVAEKAADLIIESAKV
ncbi:GMC oxidoreductase [Amniculicola lignicola CBS 123094]|uniref:GMC oxidoreductase n=1 Tax=Amniculicola lignicola CBS 123094 TaxID=1392246 RepID=A0A6A5W5C1_9PLEO|nr:GMC oxidoreductase [Amniculicola lignicola CBS 123094]